LNARTSLPSASDEVLNLGLCSPNLNPVLLKLTRCLLELSTGFFSLRTGSL
jgi:hypothetical protein